MMPYRLTYVWVWKFSGDRAFVFVGDRFAPSRQWRRRSEYASELNDVLRQLDRKPRAERVLSCPVYGYEARAIRASVAQELKASGQKLLSSRDRATIDAGRKPPRAVYVQTAWGRSWYPTVTAAARAMGLDKSTVTRAARDPDCLDVIYDTLPLEKKQP